LMQINVNQALFALLGTTYGGDGIRTFALPTGKPVFTLTPGVAVIQCMALVGIFPSQN
jgi:microcystin-dependent protein